MIVSISVSNFRSFNQEETFALTASNRFAGHHDDHLVPIPGSDQCVLRLGVIYGANGAGKSNLFRALEYLKLMALSARPKEGGTNRHPFRLAKDKSLPSTIDIQFITLGTLYRFGLKVDDQRVTEEWAMETLNGKELPLYQRITSAEGTVSVEAEPSRLGSQKVVALAEIGGPQNQTFLATCAATLEPGDLGVPLRTIHNWFSSVLQLVAPGAVGAIARYLTDFPEFREFAGTFLKSSSTGIDHLQTSKNEITVEQVRDLLPKGSLLNNAAHGQDVLGLYKISSGTEVLVDNSSGSRYYKIHVRSVHLDQTGQEIPFELEDESDGTNRLLNLLPALRSLWANESVYFIDEIDRSLHPKLAWEFIQFFLNGPRETNSQLVVITHDTNLLDLDLLRRDEIWFAEKDQQSATHLYSLTDFQVRKDLQIRKHYLEGRFGAVPFMGDLERLIPKEPPTA